MTPAQIRDQLNAAIYDLEDPGKRMAVIAALTWLRDGFDRDGFGFPISPEAAAEFKLTALNQSESHELSVELKPTFGYTATPKVTFVGSWTTNSKGELTAGQPASSTSPHE